MEKIKRYASWFGGTLARIVEFGEVEKVKNLRLDEAIVLLDRIVTNEFYYIFNDEERILIEWLDSKFLDDVGFGCYVFHAACRTGCVELVKWMIENNICIEKVGELKYDQLYDALRISCIGNQLEVAKIIYEAQMKKYGNFIIKYGFEETCIRGYLEVAQWLVSIGADANKDNALERTCRAGHLDVIKWLISIGATIHPGCILCAYEGDSLNVLRWMEESGMKVVNVDYFCEACRYGSMKVIKWAVLEKGLNVHMFEDIVFRAACYGGRLEQAKWAYEFGVTDVNRSFINACTNEKFQLARWLYDVDAINLEYCKKEIIKYLKSGNLDYEYTERWLDRLQD